MRLLSCDEGLINSCSEAVSGIFLWNKKNSLLLFCSSRRKRVILNWGLWDSESMKGMLLPTAVADETQRVLPFLRQVHYVGALWYSSQLQREKKSCASHSGYTCSVKDGASDSFNFWKGWWWQLTTEFFPGRKMHTHILKNLWVYIHLHKYILL